MNLATICDKISTYSKLLKQHGYSMVEGGGIKPWSNRYSNGLNHIDVRGSDWTAYIAETEICSGPDPETLAAFLNEDYKTGGGL